ncbi:MAG: hypothetical protein J6R08_07125 [Opitutales bacterium]|nr:hypothetical protein [Opitutales bacterium]
MTLGGWITFLLSVSVFTSFFAFCIVKVLTSKPQKMMGKNMFKEDFFEPEKSGK